MMRGSPALDRMRPKVPEPKFVTGFPQLKLFNKLNDSSRSSSELRQFQSVLDSWERLISATTADECPPIAFRTLTILYGVDRRSSRRPSNWSQQA